MKWIINFFRVIWRIWFALIVSIPVFVASPLIFISIAFDIQWLFTGFKIFWSYWTIYLMGFWIKVENTANINPKQSYIIIGNHTSVMDILVMINILKRPFVFVGKEELAKLPIFGYLYKKSNVTVDRKSPKSKKEVFDQVEHFISKGNSIAIYPEGGVPHDTSIVLDKFKTGAFKMAIDHQLPILPVVYYNNKKHFPYGFFKGSPGKLNIKILPVIKTEGLEQKDLKDLRDYSYTIIYNELMNYELAKK